MEQPPVPLQQGVSKQNWATIQMNECVHDNNTDEMLQW